MKKILTFIILFIFSNSLFIFSYAKKTEKIARKNTRKCFITTAYYSPLPGQKYYVTGSYFRDIILNGRGHRGASGKKVFSGMLAAPSNYSFGTKIYFEGLGIGEVSDRGGAIVNAGVRGHSCDRIDIWVGWGETGLKRALYWGKRKVYGRFVSRKSKVSLNIKNFKAPNYVLRSAIRVYSNPVFSKGIGTKNSKKDIIALQKYLKKKCLYKGKIDGNYYNILPIILKIQKKYKIVKTGNEIWAGYWSASTRKLFLNGKVKNGNCNNIIKKTISKNKQKVIKKQNKKISKIIIKKSKKNIYPLIDIFDKPASKKSDKKIIEKYQKVLKKVGLYKGKIDGNYNNIIDIVIKFQLDQKLIKSKNHIAAGFIGPSTRKKLKEIYKKTIDKEIEIQRKKELEEKKKKEMLEQKKIEVAKLVDSMGKLKKGSSGEEVKILQRTLKHYGFFDYEETGYFGEKTNDALIKYQISRKIIKTKDDIGAGYVGPNTRKVLENDLLKDKALLGKLKNLKFYANTKFYKEI